MKAPALTTDSAERSHRFDDSGSQALALIIVFLILLFVPLLVVSYSEMPAKPVGKSGLKDQFTRVMDAAPTTVQPVPVSTQSNPLTQTSLALPLSGGNILN